MDIKAMAQKVAQKYHTRDPFRIAEELGMVLIFAPLFEIRGLRQCLHRRTVIYINSNLDEQQQHIVCAHELGHHFRHKGINRIFMDRNTEVVTEKYENEAHHFGLELLYTDDELQPFLTRSITEAADYMGVSIRLAEYRMQTVKPQHIEDFGC